MSKKPENHNGDEDAKLNELIREASRGKPREFVRPSADAVEAYLMGTATEGQTKEITEALVNSEEFAREILQMSQDIEALADPEAKWEEREIQQIPVPVRRHFLERYGWKGKLKAFLRKLSNVLWPKVALPLRPALLYLLLLFLVIPAYHGMVMLAKKGDVSTEVVNLAYGQRGMTKADARTIELEAQTQYELIVPLEKQILGESLKITIEMIDGTPIWRHSFILQPGSGRMVPVRLPQSKLRTMFYRLVIYDAETNERQEVYLKIVKK